MYRYKVGEEVWYYIGKTLGGDLPWRKGNIIRRYVKGMGEKIYALTGLYENFEVSEENILREE